MRLVRSPARSQWRLHAVAAGLAVAAAVALWAGPPRPATAAEAITRDAGVERLADLKEFATIADFRIGGTYDLERPGCCPRGGEGGTTLESLGRGPLRLGYIAVGTPRRNDAGEITNAVIVSPYYSGDATFSYHFWHEGQQGNAFAKGGFIGSGKLIDTERHYVVYLDALGLWGASKPSGGLGMAFPQYNYYDFVQANYRLLRDHLGVAKVKLATGVSMGAMQSYTWAVMHPDFVEAIMPVAGLTSRDPVVMWLFQLMSAAMKSDPVWQRTGGDYYPLPKSQHPNQGMMFGWSVLGHTGHSFEKRVREPWSEVKQNVFYWEPEGDQGAALQSRAADYDVNDLLYRNRALETFDLNPYLGDVTADTLILHVANDQWLLRSRAEKAARMIPGAGLATAESPLAHYGGLQLPNLLRGEVEAFLEEIGMR